MAEAKILGNIRVVKDKLTDFKKRISTFDKLTNELRESEIFLNIQITDLSQDFQQMKLLHSEIVANGNDEMAEFSSYIEGKVFQAIQNIYYKLSTNLHELLKNLTKSKTHDVTFTEFSQSTFQGINYNPNINSSSRSQPYELNFSYIPGSVPSFDGTYDKWPEFKDAFISNIHENTSLTDSSKLKLLHSLLKDDALKVIKREFGSLGSAQYKSVWYKLMKRYNHKRAIVYSYFNLLLFQPSLEKETFEGIKSLYDTTYDALASLKSLELDCDNWGDILLFIIYSKLPLKTKEVWDEKQCDNDDLPKFETFLKFIEQRFRTLECLQATRNNSTLFIKKQQPVAKKISTFQSTNTSSKDQWKSAGVVKFVCKCCGKGQHPLRKCFKFKKMKAQERFSVAESLNYCTNCLSFSHKVENCLSQGRCDICKEKHNNLLCLNSRTDSQNLPEHIPNIGNSNLIPPNIPSTSDGRYAQPFNATRAYTNTTLANMSEEDRSIIFPTALVRVVHSGQSVVLRAMLDTCSDASYITEKAAKKLKLPVKQALVKIAGVGDNATAESRGITSFLIQSLVNESFTKTMY